jgi:large subunit ribosomal protein L28
MANTCDITGKGTKMAGGYSNRTRATKFNPTGKVRRKPNLQTKSYYMPEIDKKMRITVSTEGIKNIEKKGAYKAFKDAGLVK